MAAASLLKREEQYRHGDHRLQGRQHQIRAFRRRPFVAASSRASRSSSRPPSTSMTASSIRLGQQLTKPTSRLPSSTAPPGRSKWPVRRSGDMLSVEIIDMEFEGLGFTALWPGIGIFPDWVRRKEFGRQTRVVEVKDGLVHWSDKRQVDSASDDRGGGRGARPWRSPDHRQRPPRRQSRRAGG